MPGSISTPYRRRGAALAGAMLALSGLAGLGPQPVSAAPLTLCLGSSDNTRPLVQEVTFSPDSVDVSEAPQQVEVSLQITDGGAPGQATGVSSAWADLSRPGGAGSVPLRFEHTDANTWSTVVTVPRYAPAGEWRISSAHAADDAGNGYDEESPSVSYAEHDLSGALTVSSSPSPDTEAPEATALRIGTDRVDTRRRAADVPVTVEATDSGSGVAEVAVQAHRGGHHVIASLAPGGAGELTGTLHIPTWVGTGSWKVDLVQVRDNLGNIHNYRRQGLQRLGDTTFEVVSRSDRAAPTLGPVGTRPDHVDVRTTDQRVVITARLSDRRSGVRTATAYVTPHGVPMTRIAGTPKHGTWRGSVRLTPCSRPLRDRSWVTVNAYDSAGNELQDPVRKIPVRHPDNRAPQFDFPSRTVPASGPVTIEFDEPVNGLDDASAIVVQWDGDARAYGPPLAGTWACFEGDGEDASCADGRVRSAIWTPDRPLQPGVSADVELDPEGTLSLTDLSGNPFDHTAASVEVE
jgi:hypothetical protein